VADKNEEKAVNTYDDTSNPASGMLSSPHIAFYVDRYGIIEEYDEKCLGPATYHMRIGGNVLTWEKGKKVEFTLEQAEDKNKNIRTKLELSPNSLTFITTIEKFNLTKDIIARFNLKSKWVHEGLLLGTGPIVDPELKANLLIPLHNFSSQDVTLHYGDQIISVEFTKTLNPDDPLNSGQEKKFKYVNNKSRIFDFEKYRKRIGGKRVESSDSSKFDQYDETIEGYKTSLKRFQWIGGITLLSTFIGLIALVLTTWMLVSSANKQLYEVSNIVKQYKEQNLDFRAFALKSSYDDLKKQFLDLKRYTERLNTESYLKSDKMKVDLQQLQDKFKEKKRTLDFEINELNKKLKNQADNEASKQ
jgi:deoxycytidine triphosphate deaminase